MLDEENDKRIKEAADHYHPEYDDSAWQKMEQLLDEHLPVQKERKRIIFLISSVLFIGCLLLFIGLYISQNNKTQLSQNVLLKNKTEKVVVTNPPNHSEKINGQLSGENDKNSASITKGKNSIEKDNTKSVAKKSEKTNSISSTLNHDNGNIASASDNDLHKKQKDELKHQPIENGNNRGEINHEETSGSKNIQPENKSNILTPGEKQNNIDEEKTTGTDVEKTKNIASKNVNNQTKKKPGSFANNFGVSISAGPAVSDVYHNKIGKLTLAYGAGFSYALSEKLNLRTGFYLSKKIYSVEGSDYKIPSGSLGNYEYLQNVDANCKVYEIPIKLDYSFGKTKNHNWFVSGGLSSYLMKKETYDYYYKTPAGEMYNKDWSISNKNKHFFAVLDISGGYQYFLNKQLSFLAEPYVSLPLTGIGAGKVKLNSAGILFTIKVKPFLKH